MSAGKSARPLLCVRLPVLFDIRKSCLSAQLVMSETASSINNAYLSHLFADITEVSGSF